MKRISCTFCIALLMLLLAVPGSARRSSEEPFKVTTVFLVRHAEKAATPSEDPPLTASGKTRARNLARVLGKAGIKAIFTSQLQRTRATAQPLATALGITSTVVQIQPDPSDPNKVSDQSIKDLIDRINQHSGESVLVVGHTNTIPQVIGKLNGDLVPVIPENEFDNLFIVTVYQRDKARVVQLKY